MKFAFLMLLSVPAFAAEPQNPKDIDKAIEYLEKGFEKLAEAQLTIIGRAKLEKEACAQSITPLQKLYDFKLVKKSVDKVIKVKKKNATTGAMVEVDEVIKVLIDVKDYSNANLNFIGICDPDALWERKNSMIGLHREMVRLYHVKLAK